MRILTPLSLLRMIFRAKPKGGIRGILVNSWVAIFMGMMHPLAFI
jgi:hypothetical protein